MKICPWNVSQMQHFYQCFTYTWNSSNGARKLGLPLLQGTYCQHNAEEVNFKLVKLPLNSVTVVVMLGYILCSINSHLNIVVFQPNILLVILNKCRWIPHNYMLVSSARVNLFCKNKKLMTTHCCLVLQLLAMWLWPMPQLKLFQKQKYVFPFYCVCSNLT